MNIDSQEEYNSIEVGAILSLYFGPKHISNRTYHVRGLVDHKIVLRTWSRRKQGWTYMIEGIEWFVVFRSCMKVIPPKKRDDLVIKVV